MGFGRGVAGRSVADAAVPFPQILLWAPELMQLLFFHSMMMIMIMIMMVVADIMEHDLKTDA